MNKNIARKVLTRFFVLYLLLTFGSLSWAQNHGPKTISVEEGPVKVLGDGSGTLLATGTGIDRGIGKAKDTPDLPAAATSKPAHPLGLADCDGDGLSDGLQAKLADALPADLVDVIVTFSGPGNAAFAQHAVGPFQVKREFRIIPGFAGTMTAAQARALARAPGIFRVEEDFKVSTTLDAANRDFGIEAARTAFDNVTGSGVGIGVVDTGVDPKHEQLDGGKVVEFIDCSGLDECLSECLDKDDCECDCVSREAYDDHGHGTHVSSIAAGDGDGGANAGTFKGVAPGASIYAAKVLDSSGEGPNSEVIAGVEWCAEHEGVHIISMSLGSLEPSDGMDSLSRAVNNAVNDYGKVVVVAAGNSGAGPKTVGSPGAAAKAITVGAVAEWSALPVAENHSEGVYLAPFSSRGPTLDGRNKPDIVAPGVTITAARAGSTSGYVTYSGTSMATPFVAGAVALALQGNSSLTPVDVKGMLQLTAQDRGPEGLDNDWGAGLLDGYAFVAEARGETAEPTLFPKNERVSGTVADHGEWTWPFDIAENELNMPIGVTITIEGECGAEIFGVCLWWSPDLEARLIDPNGTIIAESICTADDECGSIGRQETLHAMSTVAGTYTVKVYPCEDMLNNGIGGNFALDISTPLPAVNSNNPPGANDDGATMNENSGANSIDVLNNDSDPDGDPLTITGVTQGLNGAVTNEQSHVTYIPKSDFYGSDSFTYSISDGNGGTDTATVAVTVMSTSADNSMHIGDLDGSSKSLKRNSWQASVTVTVNDANNNPVEGATVTGHWSGKKIVNASDVTKEDGQCTLTSGGISTRIDSVPFTVDDVTHSTLSYKASDNREPDDGDISNGTSITVSKP